MVIKLSDKQIESVRSGHLKITLNSLQKEAIEDKIRDGIKDEILQALQDMRIDVTDREAELIAFDFVEDWMHVRYNIQKDWIIDKLQCIRADL